MRNKCVSEIDIMGVKFKETKMFIFTHPIHNRKGNWAIVLGMVYVITRVQHEIIQRLILNVLRKLILSYWILNIYYLYLYDCYTVMCKGCVWLIRRVFDWMIGSIAPYTFTQVETTGNTALSLFSTLSSSPLHTH